MVPSLNSRLKTWPGRHPHRTQHSSALISSSGPGRPGHLPPQQLGILVSVLFSFKEPPLFLLRPHQSQHPCCPLGLASPVVPLISCPECKEEGGLCLHCPLSHCGNGEAVVSSFPSLCCRESPVPHCMHTQTNVSHPSPGRAFQNLEEGVAALGWCWALDALKVLGGVLIADS